jgi:RNA polymerase sigma-70 factor (ECF subfamily)
MEAAAPRSLTASEVIACFDRALPEVYDYVLHRCRNATIAEDLTSETFLAAVKELRNGSSATVTVAWLIGIARHKLVDHWRRVAREERRLIAVGAPPESELPLSDIEPGRGMDVLATLNPMQTAALVLRHVDGLPVPEVARALGRSVHATETLLARARANFRRRYHDLELEDTDD